MFVMPMIVFNGMYWGYTKLFKPMWLQYRMMAEAEGSIRMEKEGTD